MLDPCGNLDDALRRARGIIRDQSFLLNNSAVKTRHLLVDPALESLGWDLSDKQAVYVGQYEELTVHSMGKLDYALCVDGVEWACVKTAPLYHVESVEVGVRNMCGRYGHPAGVATDGQTWKIWRDGSCTAIDIGKDGACESLCSILSPDSLKAHFGRKMDETVRELAPRFLEKQGDAYQQARVNANRAVGMLTDVVLDSKHRYQNDEGMYRRAERAYRNILLWAESKTAIRGVLDGIDGLDGHTREEIIRLSVPGKFHGFARLGQRRVDGEYRKGFLKLLEEFAGAGKQYGGLMDRLVEFVSVMESRDTLYLGACA